MRDPLRILTGFSTILFFFALFSTPPSAQAAGSITGVSCTAGPNPAVVGQQVFFQAVATYTGTIPSGTIQYSFTLDGMTFSGTPAYKTYQAAGTYQADVRATHPTGGNANGFCTVAVINASNSPAPTGTATPGNTPSFCGVGDPRVTSIEQLVSKLFGCGVGFVGGVAILFIIYGAFLLITSAGDPNKVRVGKEYITYAIVGLLLAIFTFVILQVIAFDILRIPGFGN